MESRFRLRLLQKLWLCYFTGK